MKEVAVLEKPSSGIALSRVVEDWECSAQTPGSIAHPDQLSNAGVEWHAVAAPATAAAALAASGRWTFEHPVDIDAFDWCFRTTFAVDGACDAPPCVLCFEGLATEAEVWLNGHSILKADNMFRSHRCDVSGLVQAENELVCVFRSLKQSLGRRRPRPRWKTNLVNHQQLRWHRTSLLGRIPGWAPCAPIVGPWRDVRLEMSPVQMEQLELRASVADGEGLIHVRGRVISAEPIEAVRLRIAGAEHLLEIAPDEGGYWVEKEICLAKPRLWWPHTHGEPALYECTIVAETAARDKYELARRELGFRTFQVDQTAGFAVKVNGEPVFCRGVCWTTADLLSPSAPIETLEHDLQLVREAGANMIRIGGTMTYESEAFYGLCDKLGILVWQDFMFANMDYPAADPAFHENIAAEAAEQIIRLSRHACVAIYCGNSEVEQQAAMLGMPPEAWSNAWFREELPRLCDTLHPGTFYLPATPTGGVLPFHARAGVTHYYGVGAYLRPVADVRRAEVQFTSECLGFANVPDAETCFEIMGGASPAAHHPRWKARVPRDAGAGWDFEDVRDHYLAELFAVDPVRLRACDMRRYLQLSRVASGEMMAQAFAEWRSGHSRNSGALVWFYKDLWPAAGWGVIDARGMPKAAYYALKRAWSNRQAAITDEGLNGLDIHLVNETAQAVSGTLEVMLLREPNLVIACREIPLITKARSRATHNAEEILGKFYDAAYAYRFGPPPHDAAVVTWYDDRRIVLSEAFHFIRRPLQPLAGDSRIEARYEPAANREYDVVIRSESFLHHVYLKADGYLPDDNFFHLPPQREKRVRFRPTKRNPPAFAADLEAINLASPLVVAAAGDPAMLREA